MKFFHIAIRDGQPVKRHEAGNHGPITTIGFVSAGEGKLLFTMARCSERDVFNRKRALQICLGRFAKGVKMQEIAAPEKGKLYEVLTKEAMAYEQKIQEARNTRS